MASRVLLQATLCLLVSMSVSCFLTPTPPNKYPSLYSARSRTTLPGIFDASCSRASTTPSSAHSHSKAGEDVTIERGGGGTATVRRWPDGVVRQLLIKATPLLFILGVTGEANAFDVKGVQLFEANCVGCHVGGGNIIGYARGKTLKKEALKKNHFDNKEAIIDLLEKGQGIMPPYASYTRKNGDVVPAKLSKSDMSSVAEYILEQAASGW